MKYIKPVFLCMIVGIFLGLFLYGGYENRESLIPTFQEKEKLYFLKVGVYDTAELMEKGAANLSNYIYLQKEQKFHLYVAITKEKENVAKIKEYYSSLGYIVNEEEFTENNKEFISVLKTYDEMLQKTNDKTVIQNIVNGVLSKYEELNGNE
ncbi:MAG: hypothetical protein PHN72_02965 [Bacilli bacterium]|nr:hypothetical protein [Bacilli bacterium]